MTVDLLIRGGTVVGPSGAQPLDIGISGGRIACLAAPGQGPAAATAVDAGGLHVLPGLIDTHVHIREPGSNEREDFSSGTAAAAAGGITTILEMPISIPPVYNAEILRRRVEIAESKALVDFGLYGGAGPDNLDDIALLAEAGAVAFKTFRTAPAAGREHEFRGISCPDDGDMLRVFERVAATGLPAAIHAEHQPLVRLLPERPEIAEVASVAVNLELARAAGARLQIAHTSAPRALELLHQARAGGQAVTVETCPHYLVLTDADFARHGPYARIQPPLRSAASQEQLWQHLLAGDVDVIGTDHAPYRVDEKEPFWNDVGRAAAGAPGLEAMLPLLLAERERLDLPRLVRLLSENAARIFGLYPRKGCLLPGADADLVLCDLRQPGTIQTAEWLSKARVTARLYEGRATGGRVCTTLVRGRVVFADGRIVAPAGWGRFVKP